MDVEQRCLTDLPGYESTSYDDRVNVALIRVKPEIFDVHVLVFWWTSVQKSSTGSVEVRVVDISTQYERVQQRVQDFLARDRAGMISREDFLNYFSIKDCSSSAKIQLGRESITIHAVLRYFRDENDVRDEDDIRGRKDTYYLELAVTQPVTNGIIDKGIAAISSVAKGIRPLAGLDLFPEPRKRIVSTWKVS